MELSVLSGTTQTVLGCQSSALLSLGRLIGIQASSHMHAVLAAEASTAFAAGACMTQYDMKKAYIIYSCADTAVIWLPPPPQNRPPTLLLQFYVALKKDPIYDSCGVVAKL